MSLPHRRLLPALAALALLPAFACSKGDDGKLANGAPATPATPIKYEPLSDADLLSLKREQVTLTFPFGGSAVSKDPTPQSAKATLSSVTTAKGPTFDRTVFEFKSDTDFPGYRVAWHDVDAAVCGPEKAPTFGTPATLVVRFDPATTRPPGNNTTPMADANRRPGLPNLTSARMLCDTLSTVVWTLGATDSTAVRLLEMRDPQRLVVDIAHKGAQVGTAGTSTSDSGAPTAGR
jgi:hypothetical protein